MLHNLLPVVVKHMHLTLRSIAYYFTTSRHHKTRSTFTSHYRDNNCKIKKVHHDNKNSNSNSDTIACIPAEMTCSAGSTWLHMVVLAVLRTLCLIMRSLSFKLLKASQMIYSVVFPARVKLCSLRSQTLAEYHFTWQDIMTSIPDCL